MGGGAPQGWFADILLISFLSWTEELVYVRACTHDRHALLQLAVNGHVE